MSNVFSKNITRLFLNNTIEEILSEKLCFFFQDYKKKIIKFSGGLKREFNFSTIKYWHDLGNYFDENDFFTLEAIINNSENNKDISHTLKSIDGKKYYQCMGGIHKDNLNKPEYLFLVFTDITNKAKDAYENSSLNKKIKNFSDIVNSLPIPIWQRNAKLEIIYFNLSYSHLIGGTFEKLKKVEEIELSDRIKEIAKKVKLTRQVEKENIHIVSGKERKLYQVVEIPTDEGTIGYANDISEYESLHNELSDFASTQNAILDSSSNALTIFSNDTHLRFYNTAFVNLWKLEERWLDTNPTYGEILEVLREKRKLPEQVDFKDFKSQHIKLFNDLIDNYEEFFYLPDGRTLRVSYVPHTKGGLLISYEDITNRLALERSFNTLMAVKKATLDNLHEGVAVFGEDGRLKLSNPTYAKIWHLDQKLLEDNIHISDILEKSKLLYNYGSDWNSFKQKIISHTLNRAATSEKIHRKDGVVLNWLCVPLPDGATLMTYDDITDSYLVERSLRERYEALEQVNKLKSKFLANVSYELRSPLTTIKGYTEMLLNPKYSGDLEEKQRHFVESIYKSSVSLTELIDGILDIASIEAGYMQLNIENVDIYNLLKEVENSKIPIMKQSKISFTANYDKNIGNIKADPRRIRQIIEGLLDNSVKYTEPGGKIILSAKEIQENEVVISVEDNGIGINKEEQLAVFEKFYKLPALSKKKTSKPGTGLGLSIAKSLVELHGGRIELESKPNKGTKVSCFFKRNQLNI